MKTFSAVAIASLYGLLIRIIFGFYAGYMQILSISLMFAAPFAIGYLTVALSKPMNSGFSAFGRPWLTSLVLLIVTSLLLMEGIICWVMIYPFFSVVAGIGGVVAYQVQQYNANKDARREDILDDFNDPKALKTSLLLLLPIGLGMVEQDRLLTPGHYTIAREVIIQAPPSRVWAALSSVPNIQPGESRGFWSRTFQLPRHLKTTLDTAAVGGRRIAYFERGLSFEETITAYVHESHMTVAIKADPGSIPPQVLDEHLVVGGRHFKALSDTYQLSVLPDGRCKLQLTGQISINTPINWYAQWWAKRVLGDMFHHQLKMIAQRATQQ